MATFANDMQAISSVPVQQTTHSQQSAANSASNATSTTASTSSSSKSSTNQATIIQAVPGGSSYIVTISENQGDPVQETVQIQPGGYNSSQYVEGNSENLYQSSNGQMQNYSADYNGQQNMYTQYYQGSPNSSQMSGLNPVSNVQGQISLQPGSTYQLVHQTGTIDGEGQPLTHTTRASPVTESQVTQRTNFDAKCWQREVQWLIDNYETAEGVSLPRSTLYNHYLRHCQEQKMDPMNPASFGKLIRSVFLGLRTRRLGTRGNSKYHYYGIRIKATSSLNQFPDEQSLALRQQPMGHGKRYKTEATDIIEQQHHQHQQFLGDATTALPSFGHIEISDQSPLPPHISNDLVRTFEYMYQEHCEAILDVVVNMQFPLIEALWQAFWRNLTPDQAHNAENAERRLPCKDLYAVCKLECTQNYVRKCDYAFYHALVEVLIPDVLRPIPSSLTQAIRNFAKSLEGWLKGAMEGAPEEIIATKTHAVGAFAQTLRRYTSLNHLAQAARAVLQNTSQINQMLADLNRVDFANVQEQASWVCQCDDAVVTELELDFKVTLQQQNTLEQWAVWLEGVVNKVLQPHEGRPSFPTAARQFLLKWSFYSSMVIRDLTLRSAASFGSFHLIRLLYDEYMFYLIERKVAAASGETPIAVMGEYLDLSRELQALDSEPGSPSMGCVTKISPVNSTLGVGGAIPTPQPTNLTTITPVSRENINIIPINPSNIITTTPTNIVRVSSVNSNHVQIINTATTNSTPTIRTITSSNSLQKVTINNGSTGTPITVVASNATAPGGPKTYHVVMPMHNNNATTSTEPVAKKLKTDYDTAITTAPSVKLS